MRNGFQLRVGVLLTLGIILLNYQNCAYVGAPGDDPNQMIQSSAAQDPNTDAAARSASLEKDAMAILNARCASCHNSENSKGDIGFITDINSLKYYRLVVPGEPHLSPLYESIAQGEMPPSGPLGQAQVQIIYDWIFEGMSAKQGGGVTPPGGVVGVLEPKFQSIFVNIVQPKCLGCHNNTSANGLDLGDYNKVMTIVARNSPGSSAFYTSINTGRMPKGRAMLSASELTAVRDWITNGAADN